VGDQANRIPVSELNVDAYFAVVLAGIARVVAGA